MNRIAPIGSPLVAGRQPAMPGPVADTSMPHPFVASAAAQVSAIAPHLTDRSSLQLQRGGNSSVVTTFDRSPALLAPVAQAPSSNASPVARAYAAWSR